MFAAPSLDCHAELRAAQERQQRTVEKFFVTQFQQMKQALQLSNGSRTRSNLLGDVAQLGGLKSLLFEKLKPIPQNGGFKGDGTHPVRDSIDAAAVVKADGGVESDQRRNPGCDLNPRNEAQEAAGHDAHNQR